MNLMSVQGFQAKIEYDPQQDRFRGEILGLNGGADFFGRNPKDLRTEFRKSLSVFLAVCRVKGIEPRRSFSGRFNLRIPPQLHEQLAIAAQAEGKSIDTLAQEALQERVALIESGSHQRIQRPARTHREPVIVSDRADLTGTQPQCARPGDHRAVVGTQCHRRIDDPRTASARGGIQLLAQPGVGAYATSDHQRGQAGELERSH